MHAHRSHDHNKTGKPFKHRRESWDSTEIQILQDNISCLPAWAQSIPIQPFTNWILFVWSIMSRIHPVLIFHSQFQGRLSCICTVETRTRFISSASSYHLQTAFTPLHSRVWTCWAESNKSTMKTWRSLSHCKVEPARRDKEAPLQSNLNSTLLKSSFHSPFTLISTAKPCSMRFVVLHFHENLDQ